MINCAVTVMPVCEDDANIEIGFLRRSITDDSYAGKLVAPGGKVEETDGELIDGIPYYSVEHAAARELMEEAGLVVDPHTFFYFCSLTLPDGRVVISLYYPVEDKTPTLEWLDKQRIEECGDFAPGMKQEALLLLESI